MGTKWSEIVVHPEDCPHGSNHIFNYAQLSPALVRVWSVVLNMRLICGITLKALVSSWRHAVLITNSILGTPRLVTEKNGTKPESGHDHRCNNCARLLGKESYEKAVVEIKCPRSGECNDVATQ